MKSKNEQNEINTNEAVIHQTVADFKNSTLIVSVFINVFVLTTWLVIAINDVAATAAH